MTEIKVTIGTFEREFILVQTNAPQGYDGFGSLEMYSTHVDGEDKRYILVDKRHMEWQEGCNRSGLHSFEVVEMDLTQWCQEKLYQRMIGGGE